MKLRPLLFIVLLVSFNYLKAQNPEILARSLFLSAENNFSNGNTQTALSDLRECLVNLDSKTNQKVEYLFVRIFSQLDIPDSTMLHLNKYFRVADEGSANYNYMVSIVAENKRKIDKLREQERIRKEEEELVRLRNLQIEKQKEAEKQRLANIELVKKNSVEELLIENSNSISSTDLSLNSKFSIPDKLTSILNKSNYDLMNYYIRAYPNGQQLNHAKLLKQIIELSEARNAINLRDVIEHNIFINKYKFSVYKAGVSKSLEEIQEQRLFNEVTTKNKDITILEGYREKYPNGKNIVSIDSLLQYEYIEKGKAYERLKKYDKSINYYSKYLNTYPRGPEIELVTKLKANANKKLNNKFKNSKVDDSKFMMYSYDSDQIYGFSFGKLKIKGTGYYINLQANKNTFKTFDAYAEVKADGSATNFISTGVWIPNGNFEERNYSFSLGSSNILVKRFWIYYGAGLNVYNKLYQFEDAINTGGNVSEEWASAVDENTIFFLLEAGFNLKIFNALILKYGLRFSDPDRELGLIHQFGVGINLGD